jgi:hypothetical protein
MFKNYQKGVSLYFALMIMFILLAIGLGISLIIVSQMKMIRGMGDSVVALYVADTGIEHAMYNKRVEGGNGGVSGTISIGGELANYNVISFLPSEAKWQSSGNYKGVKRAIEITSPVVFDFCLEGPAPCVNPSLDSLCIRPGNIGGLSGTQTTITATYISGTTGKIVAFSISLSTPLPPTIQTTFSPLSCPLSCSSTLTFRVYGTTPEGEYPIIIEGETDIKTQKVNFLLKVYSSCPA